MVLGTDRSGALGGNISLVRKELAPCEVNAILIFALGQTYLAQTTVDKEISAVDEAALITGQEHNSMGLLNSLAEATTREVNLTTEALGVVVAEPILEEWCAVTNRQYYPEEKLVIS